MKRLRCRLGVHGPVECRPRFWLDAMLPGAEGDGDREYRCSWCKRTVLDPRGDKR